MSRQFDLYRRPNGVLVLIIQHDHLDDLRTRVVVPLLPANDGNRPIRGLNPTIIVGEQRYLVAIELPAAATEAELGTYVANLSHLRDEITRALDLLFTGV